MELSLFFTATQPDQWLEVVKAHQALKTLGPMQWVILAGEIPNPWRETPLAGTLWDSTRFQNDWGVLKTGPLIHPLLVPLIASQLGNWQEEDVWAVTRWKARLRDGRLIPKEFMDQGTSGVVLLKELLDRTEPSQELAALGLHPSDLVFDHIPVHPIALRMAQELEPGVYTQRGDLQYLHQLIEVSQMLTNNETHNASSKEEQWYEGVREFLFRKQQELFEKILLFHQVYPQPNRWEVEHEWLLSAPLEKDDVLMNFEEVELPDIITPDMVEEDWEENGSINQWYQKREVPIAVLPLDNGKVWVQYVDQGKILNLNTQEWSSEAPTKGELIGFVGIPKVLGFKIYEQICLYNWELEKWVSNSKGIQLCYMEELSPEKAFLVNMSRHQVVKLEEVYDYPLSAVRSRDGKYIWVEDKNAAGGIYHVDSGWHLFNPGHLDANIYPPLLTRSGTVQPLSMPAQEVMEETLIEATEEYRKLELEYDPQQDALGRRNEQWWLFFLNTLWIDGKPIWRIDIPITAAAFDDECQQLYLANKSELLLLSLDDEGMEYNRKSFALGVSVP